MKLFKFALTLLVFSSTFGFSQADEKEDTSAEEVKVKEAIISWANNTFHSHSEYRFENFYVFWSEEYDISKLRTSAYKDMLTDLEKDKEAGRYKGGDEEYKKEHDELQTKYDGIVADAANITNKADHFQISFWTNIKTNDGITVYYEHIVKVNSSYEVYEATQNSSIGAKSESTAIVYKKDADMSILKKKVNKPQTGNRTGAGTGVGNGTGNKTGSGNKDSGETNEESTNTTKNNGSVSITIKETPELIEEGAEEIEEVGTKKKKKKSKKKS